MSLIELDRLEKRVIFPGYNACFVHTGNMTIAYVTIDAGAILPEHTHPHEQVVNLIEGEFELTVKGEIHRMKPGTTVSLKPNVPHAGSAITASFILDVFHPEREDFK